MRAVPERPPDIERVVRISTPKADTITSSEHSKTAEPKVVLRDVNFYYGTAQAIFKVNLDIAPNLVTAFIGPSGCGKSTVLRCLNRMNDLIEIARIEGSVAYHGVDLYDPRVDPVEVRRRIGMVFQKPNPFPKSIYDNIVFGPKIAGM